METDYSWLVGYFILTLILLCISVYKYVKLFMDYDMLELRLDALRQENRRLVLEIESLKIFNFRNASSSHTKYTSTGSAKAKNSSNSINGFDKNELKDVIKFAMKNAHPDNPNGNNEKFIKYKEMYDKLE